MHGHNYVALFYAIADQLDDIGRVIDFSVLKERLGGWIDQNWDHTSILYEKDVELIDKLSPVNKKPIFISSWNPTAENMADHLLRVVAPEVLAGTGVQVRRVQLWETENCFAEASL